MNYGEGFNPSSANDSFSISRPTIELPLDEILFSDEETNWLPADETVSSNATSSNNNSYSNNRRQNSNSDSAAGQQERCNAIHFCSRYGCTSPYLTPQVECFQFTFVNENSFSTAFSTSSSSDEEEEEKEEEEYVPSALTSSPSKRNSVYKNNSPLSQTVKEVLPETVTPTRLTSSIYGTRSSTPTARPHLQSVRKGW